MRKRCERWKSVCFCFVHAATDCYAAQHNQKYTQSFTCTWHSIDKLLIAWAYAFVCVCVWRLVTSSGFNFTQQHNQTKLTGWLWRLLLRAKFSILTSQFCSLVLWLLPCGILIWCFDFQFFVQPMRSVYMLGPAIQTENEYLFRMKKEKKNRRLNMKIYSKAPKHLIQKNHGCHSLLIVAIAATSMFFFFSSSRFILSSEIATNNQKCTCPFWFIPYTHLTLFGESSKSPKK